MKTKFIQSIAMAIALFYANGVKAQWDTITSFNQVIQDIKTFDNKLFIVGGFTKNEVTLTCNWSAYYNGSAIQRHTPMIGGSGINMISEFNGQLYSANSLQVGSSLGIGVWDGSTWQSASGTTTNHFMVYADGNDLYAASSGVLRKKTGNESFQVVDLGPDVQISRIIRYNGNLIFVGAFSAINGVAATNIAMYDGTNWHPLGTGITGSVFCLAEFNNELYVAGKVTTAGGNPVNNMAKWNGSAWSDVGGGTGLCPNGIRDMLVHENGLFVVGDFTQMGGITTGNVALWKNSNWFGLGLAHDDSFVNCIEVFNNQIYVGTFDFTKSHLFRYSGSASTHEIILQTNIHVFPNPASSHIVIEFEGTVSPDAEIRIFNIEGKEVQWIREVSGEMTVDVSDWPSGIYFVELIADNRSVIKKIIKD